MDFKTDLLFRRNNTKWETFKSDAEQIIYKNERIGNRKMRTVKHRGASQRDDDSHVFEKKIYCQDEFLPTSQRILFEIEKIISLLHISISPLLQEYQGVQRRNLQPLSGRSCLQFL